MSSYIRGDPPAISYKDPIAPPVGIASINLDIRSSHCFVVCLLDIILRTDMRKSHPHWEQLRNEIIPVSDTIVTSRLCTDVRRKLQACKTGCSEGVKSDCIAIPTEICGSECCESTAKRMACGNDLVPRVGLQSFLNGRCNTSSSLDP